MAKILRLHGTGSSTTEGWSRTGKIGKNEIDGHNGIPDPAGALAERMVVAIPSPFARMHLVETALNYLATAGAAGGTDTVHHRLVGQFWDLWELVFNYYQQRQPGRRLLVRTWNRATELANLANSPAKPLAQALTLFLSDKRFANLTDLHLFYFPGATPTEAPQLLGGTSPLTLFFPAPAVRALPVMRPEGGGHYFDGRYVALAQREREFQEYIYQQFVADADLRRLAPAVYAALDQGQLNLLGLKGDANLSQYLPLPDHAGNPVTMAGVPVRVRPDQNTVRTSDFTVQATRPAAPGWPLQNPLPLVLRPGLQMPGKFYYNNSQFGDSGSKVPATDARALPDRTLPGPDLAYPYLTLNDLLEETLLTVPYEVDGSRFVTGQLKVAPGYKPTCWPLLPVTPLYFEYFTADDLARHLTLELDPVCVRVKLSIPVSGGFTVDYERAYYDNPRTEGLGRLLTTNVGLSIFPFVKIEDAPELNDFYKVMLVDANNIDPALVNKPVELRFGVQGRLLSETGTEQSATAYRRTPKTVSNEGSTYYEIKGTPFDYVQLASPAPAAGQALLVPKWRTVRQGTKEFRFAIDFGTTNTHVAYHDGPSQPPQPFGFGPDDTPVAMLKKPADGVDYSAYEQLYRGIEDDPAHNVSLKRWQQYTEREFVPSYLGTMSSPYNMPMRTATSESENFSTERGITLGNINIGFGFSTEEQLLGDTYHTSIKWETKASAAKQQERVKAFFHEMLLLIRSKVALNRGNIAATKIVWFMPLSFAAHTRNLYQSEWDELYQSVFKTNASTQRIPESVSPYFYLTKTDQITLDSEDTAAFIDVGGGTTDILFYTAGQPTFNTSFRFAGEDLWGDGGALVKRGKVDNGLVAFGIAHVNPAGLDGYARQALSKARGAALSSDAAFFLFSQDAQLGFSKLLMRAEHLRVILYLHFGATVYHLGQLAAAQPGQPVPRYLCYTGSGSLYVRLLAAGPDMQMVEKLAAFVLEQTIGKPVPHNFSIKLPENPKQTTANGGVLAEGNKLPEPPQLRPIGTGAPDDTGLHTLEPATLLEQTKQEVLANVRACLKLLLDHPQALRLQDELGIRREPKRIMNIMERHLTDSFSLFRQQYAGTLRASEPIPETLFFLPLKNALFELSKELNKAG